MEAERRIQRLCMHLEHVPVVGPSDELVPAPDDIKLSDDDMQALALKYRQERDKRLNSRQDNTALYKRLADLAEIDERFARMLQDPYPRVVPGRPLLTDDVEVCIVGAGYGGLCCGARLVQAGLNPNKIRLLDKAGDVGGTWYWNRYPGAMCDIESYVYMPMCEELGYVPTEKYAHQPEIYRHSRLLAQKHGLYENACFGAQVNGMVWDDNACMWNVTTDRGDAFRARYCIVNFGVLTDAKLPGVPGIENFQGNMFHTSRWDYAYTGGSTKGDLHRLGDKRVAIIGTGATAVQVVPHLGEAAKHVYVFQRTPSSVDIRNNRATSEDFANEYLTQPGWQKERQANFYAMTMSTAGAPVDLVNDGWTEIIRNLMVKTTVAARRAQAETKSNPSRSHEIAEEVKKVAKLAQLQQMEKIRRRAELVVKDPKTAEALKPWYDQFCKRPCFHDEYLSTFNRSNVTLVHTDGRGIDHITPRGVVANGMEYEVDCIVMATGFEVGGVFDIGRPSSFSFDIVGKQGITLRQKWDSAEHKYGPGPKTYQSYHSSGFPNFFMQNAPQGAFTTNFTYALDESAKHFAHIIARMNAAGHTKFDVKPEIEERYVDKMWELSPISSGQQPNCTPGYYNAEGRVLPAGTKLLGGSYPGAPIKLFIAAEKERKDGTALDIFDLQ